MFDAVTLKCAEIVAIPQVCEELFENRPISIAGVRAELAFKMALEIVLNTIVIEQSVVDVNQKYDGFNERHALVTPRDRALRSRLRLHIRQSFDRLRTFRSR